MAREIKFRGWDGEKRRMWDWYELRNTHPLGCLYSHGDGSWEVMQYTGLRDKNGVEIYEGDICRYEDRLYEIRWVDRCAKWGAKVTQSQHVLIRGCTFPLQDYVEDEKIQCILEVIGNIYENPELLQK